MITAITKMLLLLAIGAGAVLSVSGSSMGTFLLVAGLLPSISFLIPELIRTPLNDVSWWQWVQVVAYAALGWAVASGHL